MAQAVPPQQSVQLHQFMKERWIYSQLGHAQSRRLKFLHIWVAVRGLSALLCQDLFFFRGAVIAGMRAAGHKKKSDILMARKNSTHVGSSLDDKAQKDELRQ